MVNVKTSYSEQDAKLVRRLHDGDRSVIGELHYIYFDRLYSLVFHQVDRNRPVAEDIVQETFLAALGSASGFRGQSSLYTWLCSIAHHKIADHYRRQSRERERIDRSVDVDALDCEGRQANELQPDSLVESAETKYVVNQALAKLPSDYQQVLTLKYFEEMSVVEISHVMGRSPKSVEGLLTRARKALQVHLEELADSTVRGRPD